MIDHVKELLDAGVDALKIEGRNKSSYYTAVITNAYQHAIAAALENRPLEPVFRDEVEKVSHRKYYTGFYFGTPATASFMRRAGTSGIGKFLPLLFPVIRGAMPWRRSATAFPWGTSWSC